MLQRLLKAKAKQTDPRADQKFAQPAKESSKVRQIGRSFTDRLCELFHSRLGHQFMSTTFYNIECNLSANVFLCQ